MKRKICLVVFVVVVLTLLTACSASIDDYYHYPTGDISQSVDGLPNYKFEEVIENDFTSTADKTSSYFSLDRNTASYSMMRREINQGLTINKSSVRLEEYVNYFNYAYERPSNGNELALSGNLFDCPWNSAHKLFTIGVAAEEVTFDSKTSNNIVFLIDTSGSMYGDDRLGLIQQSFTMLLEHLNVQDTVSIVTYAGDSRVALDGARGADVVRIANVLQDLEASGSTNGEGGIQKAYALAEKYFVEGGNNRVLLATDGDFNVGVSDKQGLKELISSKRKSGIYLTVLGVGMNNTNDVTLKTLTENGNGNYFYLDSVSEARKVLVEELNGTFNVVAKDAKIGVEFNKDVVESFRLIGYETKMMSQEEFEDAKKDAGEIGSGHTVTAVYELTLKEGASGNVATAEVRYKTADGKEQDKKISRVYTTEDYSAAPDEDSVFIGCVVEYGLILRQSEYKADASFAGVLKRLQTLSCVTADNADPFKAEFAQLVQKAQTLYSK